MDANSLRQAAYLLVAHFVVVTGFSLLGTAPLDYARVLMMLAFLAGAVAVLFRPWKMGWVMIVLYAWHAANPSLLWLWSLWTSPELQPGAK